MLERYRNILIIILASVVLILLMMICYRVGQLEGIAQESAHSEMLARELAKKMSLNYEMKARQLARHYEIDEELVLAVIWQESRFNPDARSNKGATGLMQLMPNTLKELGVPEKHSWEENLDAGIRYIKWLTERGLEGNELLMAYNWGIGNLRKHQMKKANPPKETRNYVTQINKHLIIKPWACN